MNFFLIFELTRISGLCLIRTSIPKVNKPNIHKRIVNKSINVVHPYQIHYVNSYIILKIEKQSQQIS